MAILTTTNKDAVIQAKACPNGVFRCLSLTVRMNGFAIAESFIHVGNLITEVMLK